MSFMYRMAFVALALGIISGCQKDNGFIDAPRKDIVLTKAETEYVNAGNQFAFKWLSIVNKEQPGDWFVSPLSVQYALGMLANGANETAMLEICNILGYGEDGIESLNSFVKSFSSQLSGLDPNTNARIANMILANDSAPFVPAYKNRVMDIFNATTHEMSFNNSKAVANWVNKWAKDNTNGMLKDVVNENDFYPNMLSVLGNAVYFKGKWAKCFEKKNTGESVFVTESSVRKTVPMMKQESDFVCTQTAVYKGIVLPYGNGAFQMEVFLPIGENSINDVITFLCKNGKVSGTRREADVWLPKFESFTVKMPVKSQLILLGMSPSTFNGYNFMDIQPELGHQGGQINEIYHSAGIKVDESGAEAAVVTVVSMGMGAPPDAFEFHADHPFLYLISEVSTGAILFAGKYGSQ